MEPSSGSSGTDRLPPTSDYTLRSYWDRRFASEKEHDWLCTFADVSAQIEPLMDAVMRRKGREGHDARVLLVGVGNSALPKEMAAAGYRDIAATDYSEVVIERCSREQGDFGGAVRWEVMDMRELRYPDGSFDVVFDKAAMDAVLAVGGDRWEPDPELLRTTDVILKEAWRVLSPGGVYLQISFSQPHFRKQFLLSEGGGAWKGFRKESVDRGLGYFLYLMYRAEPEEGTGGA
ncbi:S-adenosyl-L-methionine-dependent methyltransferase [Hyaloraphidium curvatum]|nr:S-adenosyl-L-methionine-dependent methyltransferase [Hyaloraphidium curvatum]